MKLKNGIKELHLIDSKLVFYYANNRGRGDNNVTIYRIRNNIDRVGNCQNQELLPFIAKTQTSGWSGNVNFSKRVMQNLGVCNYSFKS